MDPRAAHHLIAEMVLSCKPTARELVRKRAMAAQRDQSKRYGTYFPSKASFNSKWNFADDESTWEFSAPVAHIERSSSTDTCSSTSSSPAQDIVLRYRAGMTLEGIMTRSSTTSDASTNTDASWETALDNASIITDSAPPVPEKDDLKAIHRQSRCDALMNTLEEALTNMKNQGRGENDRIVCHRPGCRDTLRDVKALMYHLHIHNIHDQSFTCAACKKHHESALQLSSHCCPTQHTKYKSPPTSPIRDGFFRVFSKISRHST